MDQHARLIIDAIFSRRSIRVYQADREVERAKIVALLEAAMAAPSACNIQPWEFIVVTDREIVRQLRQCNARNGDYNAPVVIVVCSYPALIPWSGDSGIADCSAAIENMLVAAAAMGLGSVWIGGFDEPATRLILDIPDEVVPLGVVYFGYPAEQKEPRTKYLDDLVFWERYDRQRAHRPRPGDLIQREG